MKYWHTWPLAALLWQVAGATFLEASPSADAREPKGGETSEIAMGAPFLGKGGQRMTADASRVIWPELVPEEAFESVAPLLRKPGFLETVTNAAGYRLTRLGGSRTEMSARVPLPSTGSYYRDHRTHWYSRSSATSATGLYAISWIKYGFAALWRLRPEVDFVAWLEISGEPNDEQALWDKSEEAAFWWTRGNELMLTRFDERTFEPAHETVRVFEGYSEITFGTDEGDFSLNGDKVALQSRRRGDDHTWLIAYNIKKDRVVGERRLEGDINSLSVDPSGSWITWRNEAVRKHFSLPWSDIEATPTMFDSWIRHGDLVVDAAGIVWFARTSGRGVLLYRVDGSTKEGILHWVGDSADTDGHISGIDGAPGKFIYTRYKGGQVILLDIAQPNRQAVIGYTRHCETDEYGSPSSYSRQPRGSSSIDGRYIVFDSEWCGEDAGVRGRQDLPDMYVIELPFEGE